AHDGRQPEGDRLSELEIPADEERDGAERLVVVPELDVHRSMVGGDRRLGIVRLVRDEVPAERRVEGPVPRSFLVRWSHGEGARREQDGQERRPQPERTGHPPSAVTTATRTAPMPSIDRPTSTGRSPEYRPTA